MASRPLLALLIGGAAQLAAAQCPASGLSAHDRCWYLGDQGASCKATCASKGLGFSHFVASDDNPMVPQILGRAPSTKQFSWGRTECYVPSGDRYHTAKTVPDSNAEDRGEAGDWSQGPCRLACACTQGAAAPAPPVAPYPTCHEGNAVFRHAGAHAIFVDVSTYGSTGCWQNDCKNSDKFNADSVGICARACAGLPDCTHWSYGEQEDAKKCFFRKSDGGREAADGWVSGQKACAPEPLPDAYLAFKAGEILRACDAGKSAQCPDMPRAVTTWRFAIKHLKKATEGKVDPNTINFVNQVSDDTDAFAAQMSEDNFPVIASNNRQVFNALDSWMASQAPAGLDMNDLSLPNPVRGKLCGANSCYEALM